VLIYFAVSRCSSCPISRYSCLFSDRVLWVLIYSAASRCSPCPRTRSCHCHLWFLLVIAPQERICFPRTPHHTLFLSALLAHRAAQSIDLHRSIRCTPLRVITQSPRPSRCHLSMSYCSNGQTVESPSRRRRRPLARNTRTIYRAKCFKCGWDCLFLNKSAPYASIHLLLYTLIALPSSQPRSKRELDFKFVSGRPMKRLEVEFEAYAQSHSYDSPLISQPPMLSSSSSSQLRPTLGLLAPSLDFPDVEPVTCPWKDVYSERSTV
jgi:hypothetical protein